MRALLLHNPYSRRALKQKEIDYIKKELSVDYTTDIFETQGSGSMDKYVEMHGEAYDLIIACGGDGTIHEAACGILKLEKKPKLAIIPRGTMNDVAKCYKIPKSVRKCVKIIHLGNTERHSAYHINDTYFLYGLAIGRYADVSYAAGKKRELGWVAYYLACLKEFFVSKPVTITANGEKSKVSQAFILNTKYLAGYKVEAVDDDRVHFKRILFKNRLRDTFSFLFFLLSKGKRHSRNSTFDEITIEGDNIIFTLDGERYISSRAVIYKSKDFIEILHNKAKR